MYLLKLTDTGKYICVCEFQKTRIRRVSFMGSPVACSLKLPEIDSGYLVSAAGSPVGLQTQSAHQGNQMYFWYQGCLSGHYLTTSVTKISILAWFKGNLHDYFTIA